MFQKFVSDYHLEYNLGLSNYKRMKNKLELKKKQTKSTCYNFRKELFSPLFKIESSFSYAFVASQPFHCSG